MTAKLLVLILANKGVVKELQKSEPLESRTRVPQPSEPKAKVLFIKVDTFLVAISRRRMLYASAMYIESAMLAGSKARLVNAPNWTAVPMPSLTNHLLSHPRQGNEPPASVSTDLFEMKTTRIAHRSVSATNRRTPTGSSVSPPGAPNNAAVPTPSAKPLVRPRTAPPPAKVVTDAFLLPPSTSRRITLLPESAR